jgi:hypothetical protein
MEVNGSNNIQKPNVNKDVEAVGKVEDLIAEFMSEELDEEFFKTKSKKRAKEKDDPKSIQRGDKSASVALADNQVDVKELVEQFMDKTADDPLKKRQGKVSKRVKEEMTQKIRDHFRNEFKDKSQDSVKLSSQALSRQNKDAQQHVQAKQLQQQAGQKNLQDQVARQAPKVAAPILAGSKKSQKLTIGKDGVAEDFDAQQNESSQKIEKAKVSKQIKSRHVERSVKNYIAAYADALVTGDPKKKRESRALATEAEKTGYPLKKIRLLEENTERIIRSDLRGRIKEAFTNMALTYTPGKMNHDLLKSSRHLQALTNIAEEKQVFGPGRGSFVEQGAEAKQELNSFVADELDKSLIAAKVNSDDPTALVKAFNEFNTLAGLTKFDSGAYMRTFNQKLEDLGLHYFEDPDKRGGLDTQSGNAGAGSQGQGQQQQHQQSQYLAQSESEEELSNLYMKLAVRGDFKSQIELRLKIKRLQSGLLKTGAVKETDIAKLKKEGEAMAKVKLTDLLYESLEERATLPVLKGPQFNLIKQKRKMALQGLKRMGQTPPKDEMRSMQNKINKAMFTIVKEEYLKTEVALEASPANVGLIRQRKDYLALLERLKSESDIREDIKPKMFGNMTFSSNTNVIEAA